MERLRWRATSHPSGPAAARVPPPDAARQRQDDDVTPPPVGALRRSVPSRADDRARRRLPRV
ncbi:hypothetical protein E1193_11890 [Micromonospora sp. KC606]|uniref:hypothetical protein n=1 Tax=Micromonospora sp. KC606 TaxID=2530379 RepID=UPI001050ABFE|nr:hypothetical protein [Micromonospora sp. KC606]TDC82436.1 hypothetical protein E1193_11890 [Micromonospora sp. KC606]